MTTTTTLQQIQLTHIKFPEIKLQTRDAHKLRGYFGNLFKEHSTILHNHYEDETLRYGYPLVQYKVIDGTPILLGVGEGAELLPQLFLKIKTIDINGQQYNVNSKNIDHHNAEFGFSSTLHEYRFKTLWMALNQENYPRYQKLKDEAAKNDMLNSIVVGHILGLFRNFGIELRPEQRLMARVQVKQKSTNFKDNKMIAFDGSFIVNAILPNGIGLGKSVSRGFGTIEKK